MGPGRVEPRPPRAPLERAPAAGHIHPVRQPLLRLVSRVPRTSLRRLLALAFILPTGDEVAGAARVGAPEAREISAAARAVADEFFATTIETFPEQATFNGMTEGPHGRLTDNSLEAVAAWRKREDAWLDRLRVLDPSALVGQEEWVLYGILREQLEASVAQRVCRLELWPVNSYQEGWQSRFTDLARLQPVGNPAARTAALARLRGLPRFLDTEISNLRRGVLAGYTAPKVVVRSVIAQLDGLLANEPADSPFSSPAVRDPEPTFRTEYLRVIAADVFPAIGRYRKYLADEYLGAAREALGVSANPNGAACYAASVRAFATVARSPDEVYAQGLREMDRIEAAMRLIAEQDFATSDPWGLLARLSHEPQYTFRSGDEIIAMAQAALDRARAAMPRAFGRVPKADVIIEPYPLFRQKAGAPGQYNAAPEDGSRPGIFNINPYLPGKQSRSDPEAITFHETLPGHHLQGSIARERKGAHPLLRYFYNSGFGEGWALYAEQLADEMGLYSSPAARIGMLQSDAFRAARLVLDAGLHTKGWTRAQAVNYLAKHTTKSPAVVEGEVDRYISWPGQASSYMIGKLEILRLREEAQRALGPHFDLRSFHDLVLENGAVTLPMLEQTVRRFVAAERARPRP